LGNIAKQSADSTVAAATHVARCEDRILAISSKAALEAQGLKILAEDIANLPSKENFTQMLVLQKNGHHDTLNTTQEHHALLVRLHESAGTLGNLLQAIRVAQMNLTSLHSIKKAGIAQDVDFFIELENTDPRALSILQRQLQNPEHGLAKKCTVLGSWNTRLFTAEAPDVAVPLRTGFESGTCNPSKRFHRITIRPADYQGVLADITTMIRQASMNLLDIDSRTEGHKQYSFSMVMDGVSSNPAFTELLHEQLATSPMTYSLSWQSGDTVSSL
jgi:prephenate dehydratase